MSLFGLTKTPTLSEKSFISSAESQNYRQGGNKPQTRSFKNYLETVSKLDTTIRTSANIASNGFFDIVKVDSKGNEKAGKIKQFDEGKWNDYQTKSEFMFELFGTLLTYEKAVIIPEESKHPHRAGLIDFHILPDDQFYLEAGDNKTIEKVVYRSSMGEEIEYPSEEIIYINRNMNASNLLYPIPRIKSMLDNIQNILNINDMVQAYTQSGGKSSIVASTDSLLNEEQAREVKREFQNFLDSTKPKAMLMNSEKFSLNKVSEGLSSSGVLDMAAWLSQEILRAYNVPDYLLGDTSSSTQSGTFLTATRTFFNITLRPLFISIADNFSYYFRDVIGVKNIKFKPNYSEITILEDDVSTKMDVSERLLKLGAFSPNDVRAYLDFERKPIEAMDRYYAPSYLQGTMPVSYDNFEADIQRILDNDGNPTESEVPTGDGGSNNAEDLGGRA